MKKKREIKNHLYKLPLIRIYFVDFVNNLEILIEILIEN